MDNPEITEEGTVPPYDPAFAVHPVVRHQERMAFLEKGKNRRFSAKDEWERIQEQVIWEMHTMLRALLDQKAVDKK